LTRTTHVEQALSEVRKARGLAAATGDPNYFSRAVGQYEKTLDAFPEDDCIRYALAWAYYMQAYLYGEQSRKAVRMQAMMSGQPQPKSSKTERDFLKGAEILASALTGSRPDPKAVPHIPGALEGSPDWAVPQIRAYFDKCLRKIDEVVRRNPHDVWAQVYAVHITEEYSGDHQTALNSLLQLKKKYPENPAVTFFLADAYTREGHYGEGLSDFTKALEERFQGK
jgi:tetratricopeptide (TPR) repeat protein